MLIFVILFGLIIGSFLNVCIYRIPKNERIDYPHSHCQFCQTTLGVLDLIPLFSYIGLKGKCRYCKEKISIQYPLIEILNAIIYLITYKIYGFSLETIMIGGFLSLVIMLTVIDIKTMLLPTKIILFGSIWAVSFRVVLSIFYQDWWILASGILAGILGYGSVSLFFWLFLKLAKKEGIGYGDVRYLGMIGLFTSPLDVGLTLFVGSIIGSIYGIILYIINHKQSMYFAFGPFLSIGALISFFSGDEILTFYLEWLFK